METPKQRDVIFKTIGYVVASRFFAVALLSVYAALAVSSIRHKCATYDELAHQAGGFSYWTYNDYRLYPENGNLPQRWAALPLLTGQFSFPERNQPNWQQSRVYSLGYDFFYHQGNDPETMLWRGRVMIVLVGIALGWIVYEWSRHLYGAMGGAISVALYSFSPTMLAHGRLTTSEMFVAATFTASIATLWITLHRVSFGRVLAGGLAIGLLAVSKFSAVLIVPVAMSLFVIRLLGGRSLILSYFGTRKLIKTRWRQFAVGIVTLMAQVVIAFVVIWAFYGFRYDALAESEPGIDRMEFGTINSLSSGVPFGSIIRLLDAHRLLPQSFLHGLAFVLDFARSPYMSYLNGDCSSKGRWYFFPYCFLVKTPLPVFAILTLSMIAGLLKSAIDPNHARIDQPSIWRRMRRGFYRTAPLWVFLIVYSAAALNHSINIGHRHILPIYPVIFILAGAAGKWLQTRYQLMALFVSISLLALAINACGIWPHYLAYFNQLVGGPRQGYRHMVDSSLDWGQDLPGLKQWLDRDVFAGQEDRSVYLAYFGTGNPDHHKINAQRLLIVKNRGESEYGEIKQYTAGLYCISATLLQSMYTKAVGPWTIFYEREYRYLMELNNRRPTLTGNSADHQSVSRADEEQSKSVAARIKQLQFSRLCTYLRQREPDHHIGYSILIYKLTDQEAFQAIYGRPPELEQELFR